MNVRLHHNVWKLYALQALRWMLLIMPVLIPFYQENGLDMQQILFVQAAFSTSLILFEVPSGYVADVLGRKLTIVIGTILAACGLVLYVSAYTFYGFLFAEMVLGIGGSLISGADTALLYDTLLEMEIEGQFAKYAGRLGSIANFSEGIAAIIGGELALISLRTPLYVEAVLAVIAIPIAFTLIEPDRHRAEETESSLKSVGRIVRYALHGHAEVKWLILYSSLVGLSTFTIVWFVQPYLAVIDFGVQNMGLNRIATRCKIVNIGSARVMEKSGMTYEGTLREVVFVKGQFQDLKLYAILKRDWLAQKEMETP